MLIAIFSGLFVLALINIYVWSAIKAKGLVFAVLSILLFIFAPVGIAIIMFFIGAVIYGNAAAKMIPEENSNAANSVKVKGQDDFPATIIQPYEASK